MKKNKKQFQMAKDSDLVIKKHNSQLNKTVINYYFIRKESCNVVND